MQRQSAAIFGIWWLDWSGRAALRTTFCGNSHCLAFPTWVQFLQHGRLAMKLTIRFAILLCGALVAGASGGLPAIAKDTVKLAFIGPLSGGNSAPGVGGRNSAQLAVQLRNADPTAKYTYELVI